MTPPSTDPPLPDRLSDAFAAEALASERQSLRIRIVALVLIGFVVLVVAPWPYSLYYLALLPLFALTGYLNFRLRRRHWPADCATSGCSSSGRATPAWTSTARSCA